MKREIIVLLVLFFSCQNEKKSAAVLSHDEMVKVLTELYIAEDKVSRLSLKPDSGVVVFNALKGKVFDKTGVADSVFSTSLDYYMDRPKDLEKIYTALIDSLNLKEQRSSFPPEQK